MSTSFWELIDRLVGPGRGAKLRPKSVRRGAARFVLSNMKTQEVSLVDRAANMRKFISIKRAAEAAAAKGEREQAPEEEHLPVAKAETPPPARRPVVWADDQSDAALATRQTAKGDARRAVLEKIIAGDDASARALARVELGELTRDGDVIRSRARRPK
jgi:hypothetical protein